MGSITDTIDVDVDLATACNQWTQFEEFPEFVMAVEEVRQISDDTLHWVTKVGPIGLGRFKEFIEMRDGEETGAWRGEIGGDNAFEPDRLRDDRSGRGTE